MLTDFINIILVLRNVVKFWRQQINVLKVSAQSLKKLVFTRQVNIQWVLELRAHEGDTSVRHQISSVYYYIC